MNPRISVWTLAILTLALSPLAPVGADETTEVKSISVDSVVSILEEPIPGLFGTEPQNHNDGFAAATLIADVALPYSNTHSNAGATMEAGEDSPCGLMDKTIWYVYPTSFQQHIKVDTFGSSFDTVLAVHQGTSLAGLGLVGCNDDSGGGLQSSLEFDTTPGLTYYFQVGGYNGATGTTVLNVDYGCGGNDNMGSPCPASLRPHRSKTTTGGAGVQAGEPAFTCGFNVGKTVWYSYTPQVAAAGPSVASTFGSNFDTVLQVFAVVAGSMHNLGCNDDTSGLQSNVAFPSAPGLTYLIQVGGYNQQSGNLQFQVT